MLRYVTHCVRCARILLNRRHQLRGVWLLFHCIPLEKKNMNHLLSELFRIFCCFHKYFTHFYPTRTAYCIVLNYPINIIMVHVLYDRLCFCRFLSFTNSYKWNAIYKTMQHVVRRKAEAMLFLTGIGD